jgi:CRISPR/Cas system type I-B associated protein Csh2 (Cas7 group RAMP superfamily)
LNEGFGKTLITLQPIIDELFDSIVADVSVKTELRQFVAKLNMPVLAPGEIVHRLFASLHRVAEALVVKGRDELFNDVVNGSVFRHR